MTPEELRNCKNSTYSFEIVLIDSESDPSRFLKLTHHLDYLLPLDAYPEVTVYDVAVNTSIHGKGYKVKITGFADAEDGHTVSKLVYSADLSDWGDVIIEAIRFMKIEDPKD